MENIRRYSITGAVYCEHPDILYIKGACIMSKSYKSVKPKKIKKNFLYVIFPRLFMVFESFFISKSVKSNTKISHNSIKKYVGYSQTARIEWGQMKFHRKNWRTFFKRNKFMLNGEWGKFSFANKMSVVYTQY